MSNYQPASRRPIGDAFRKTAHGAVAFCVRRNVHPDAISCASIVFTAAAAVCLWKSRTWPALLLAAPAFCYLRLWCNMLDGMVALASGKAGRRGEILNDFPDRISDVLVFVGVAHSGFASPWAGYWAAIFALLTAYVGTLGQAVGGRREFGGIMSKPWRMVAVHAGAWVTWGALTWADGGIRCGGLTILDWTCLAVVAGCLQTMAVRLNRTLKTLKE
jgi:phosphatidylglycerophosphate synthase